MTGKVYLTLSDGSVWQGEGTLAKAVEGELVSTAVSCGYSQTLTDPSYSGQILVFAFPSVGICGIDTDNLEGRRCAPAAVIVTHMDETETGRFESFHSWMGKNERPIIYGIDTRSLVFKLRECGTMMARIDFEPKKPEMKELSSSLVHENSCVSISESGSGDIAVALMDYGTKESIIKSIEKRGCRVIRFPHSTKAESILASGASGVILSSGPGNPAVLEQEKNEISKLIGEIPLLGIGLGCELIVHACGAVTNKMKTGHRGGAVAVLNCLTGSGILTNQNHVYEINKNSLDGAELEVTYSNLSDGGIEGVRHKRYNAAGILFQPEASLWQDSTSYIYDEFIDSLKTKKVK